MKQRIITALVLTPIAVAIILLLPTPVFAVIVGTTFLLALWEWTRLVGLESMASRVTAVVAGALLLAGLWYADHAAVWPMVIGLGLVWWLVSLAWLRHFSFAASPSPGNRVLKLVVGYLLIVPAWVALMTIHDLEPLGHWWALFALALVWAADTFAYFAGSRFGRRKLAPRISPGKTVEGAIGAFVGGALVALTGGWLLGERGLGLALLVIVALLTLAASIIGDLFESLAKRQANVKDSGALFPGHGGLLDRLDSVFAAMPVFAAGKLVIDFCTR
ncbi:MAG: phosphatidate cytidylyltransferase [Luteimonas sp.]|uniref:phosphatidate cytidylyltransferase n=1 Tax=Dokdonella sp. TaxID=2291710 RepID=UPI0025C38C9E|nr:phosphatidate cytidylyltransferase [Dokdonella sp.]MBX3692917.1 phosphatidate cytidylyltransferase [Dokdonella sp.]MCW5579856.1 phosphatidate cytidylyltransferase [Luteimonas sp.]